MTVPIRQREITGKWDRGYVLDWHVESSEMTGYNGYGHPTFKTIRTPLGELLFRLKYRNDYSVVGEIAGTAANFLSIWPIRPDYLIPIPPSDTSRQKQPVLEIAKVLSLLRQIPLNMAGLTKTRSTSQLKNIQEYEERTAALAEAFQVNQATLTDKHVLLFDDVYRSGATLSTAAELLRVQGRVSSVCVLALTETRGS